MSDSMPEVTIDSMPEIKIDGTAARKALESLRTHAVLPRKGKTELEKHRGDIIRLIIGTKGVQKARGTGVIHCNLVHSLDENNETIENVFISKGDSDPWASKLHQTGHINAYMSYDQMKKRIVGKDGKDKFLKSFNYILCDNRLRSGMAHLFGDVLLHKGKIIPVRVFENDVDSIKHNLNIQMRSVHVKFVGACLDIKLGRTKMNDQQIIENYNSVMSKLIRWLKPEDVVSMSLKTEQSVSFPIYQAISLLPKIPFQKDVTSRDKKMQRSKEKRLNRVNTTRVKHQVVSKIKPKKPL